MKPLRFEIQNVDGKREPLPVRDIDEYIWKTGNGRYEVVVKKTIKPKSQKQLGAIFGLLIKDAIAQANDMGLDTSSFLNEMVREDLPTGLGLTSDLLKELLYCLCPIMRDDRRITLSKASTIEAAKFFEDARNVLAAHGIFINEPDPNWRTK